MKGGFLHRLLVEKPWLGPVVFLLGVATVVLALLGGSPVLTNFSITPEQRQAFSRGLGVLQRQGQQHPGNDSTGGPVGSPGPTYDDSRIHETTATRGDGFLQRQEQRRPGNDVTGNLVGSPGPAYDDSRIHKSTYKQGEECNYAKGKWIGDEKRPLYSGYECKRWLPKKYNCDAMGRTDLSFEGYRWQPYGCKMPEFSGLNFLNSLCELEPLTNTTSLSTSYALHLDRPARFLKKYLHSFDTLVLNTGHHWNKVKFSQNNWELYADGKPLVKGTLPEDLSPFRNLRLHNIVRWLDSELIHRPHMKVFLRTNSPSHFLHGDWNTGGSCNSTTPLSSGSEVFGDHSGDLPAEHAVTGTRVKLLDITSISQLRSEAHVADHTLNSQSVKYDCSHWCLPGIPDTWNEILFAQI
ncbi:protein trichome birefringence-like 14 isoform X2 [Lolium perenne]|uniref:protein trichome birefringence-like 14 isoform X2 n=1 Tax=Lolium perenne TaxID=4522 RepID=UPI0021F556F9|nr:protein trichome birefringence-like 14 isoform X2 [Lolium perenne]